MINKKDNSYIFEQYRGLIKEQSDDLLSQVKKSALDPTVKQQLIALLSDPEVAAKWKGGDAGTVNPPDEKFGKELSDAKYGDQKQDTINKHDPNFANQLRKAQKEQNIAFPEQNDEELPKGKFNYKTGCFEDETPEECEARKRRQKIAKNSFAKL